MSTSSVILIIVAAIMTILILVFLAMLARNKRTEHRRSKAGAIRDKATEQAHDVGQREALADEVAARSRAAQAEAEAMAAQAASLEHQAQQQRRDATTARDELNREYARADKVDPGVRTDRSPETTGVRPAPRPGGAEQPRHTR